MDAREGPRRRHRTVPRATPAATTGRRSGHRAGHRAGDSVLPGAGGVSPTPSAVEPRLGFVVDGVRAGEPVWGLADVLEATGSFGGNSDAAALLELVSGQTLEEMRFARRRVAVGELTLSLLDTRPERVAHLARLIRSRVPLPPLVLAGALLVDGNHRTRAALEEGIASLTAFVLLPAATPGAA